MTKLDAHMPPNHSTLTVIAVDFNFVVSTQDRWSAQAEDWADNGAKLLDVKVLTLFSFL